MPGCLGAACAGGWGTGGRGAAYVLAGVVDMGLLCTGAGAGAGAGLLDITGDDLPRRGILYLLCFARDLTRIL